MAKATEKAWPADRVERWPVDSLIPYARNSRTHTPAQIDQIAASIREWGWTSPVLVGEDGTIVCGHARVQAAQKLGLGSVPVMVARGWTDAKKRAYVMADNRLAESGGWDREMLAVELGELSAADFDLPLIGFSEAELEGILGDGGGAAAPDDFAAFGEDMPTEHECPRCHFKWSGKGGGKAEE